MLHLGDGERVDAAVVDRCVSLVETTSPSALLSGSLDAARRLAARPRRASCSARPWPRSPRPARRSRRSPASPCSTTAWSAGPGSPAGTRCGSRSTCAAPAPAATGWRRPPSSSTTGIDFELAAENVVVAIFGLGEPAARAGERLVAAMREAVGRLGARGGRAPQGQLAPPPPWGELAMTPREAFLGPQEVVPFERGRGPDRGRVAGRLPARASPTSSRASA